MMERYNAGAGERTLSSKSSLEKHSQTLAKPGAVVKPGAVANSYSNGRTLDPQKVWQGGNIHKMWEGANFHDDNRKMWNGLSDYDQGNKMWGGVKDYDQDQKMWGGVKNFSDDKKMWGDRKMWRDAGNISNFSTDNRYDTKVLDNYKKLPQKWYVDNGKQAWFENSDMMLEVVKAAKFENAVLYEYPDKTYDRIRSHVDNMSMSDLNRFNFRRNDSTDPGLKRQSVGRENSKPRKLKDWNKLAKKMRKNAKS